MGFLSAIRVALAALLVNKGRTVLTSLGIVIGISAVIAMVAAGSGARYKLDERLESVGKNVILIKPGGRTQQGIVADSAPLTRDDADAIRKRVGSLLMGVTETQMTQKLVTSRYGLKRTTIAGATPDLEHIRKWTVPYGRFYTEDDVRRGAPVCLIGETVRRRLFPERPDPVGEMIRADRVQLRVIGILGEKGRSPTGADQDDQIFVPISTLQRKIVGEERVALIVTAAQSEEVTERAKLQIERLLRERHHIKPGATDDFEVTTVREMADLAVGATGTDVLMQFLLEAMALALLGGVIGITLGLAGAFGLARLASWPVVIHPAAVLMAFGVSAAVSVFFGYYPALKASRLDPIEALRYE